MKKLRYGDNQTSSQPEIRVERMVINTKKSQFLWLTGLNAILWISLIGAQIWAVPELAVYSTPSWSTVLAFTLIFMAFLNGTNLSEQRDQRLGSPLHTNLQHYTRSSSTCYPLFRTMHCYSCAYFRGVIKFRSSASFFIRKPTPSRLFFIFKKGKRRKSPMFLNHS